jgi:hypothetical protein
MIIINQLFLVYDENKGNFDVEKYVESMGGTAIAAHPFYEWVEENINKINYKLMKAIITNVVPLGEMGKKFFQLIASKKYGFENEYMKIYDNMEKKYREGFIKEKSYIELEHLGYTGISLGEKSPSFEVMNLQKSR